MYKIIITNIASLSVYSLFFILVSDVPCPTLP